MKKLRSLIILFILSSYFTLLEAQEFDKPKKNDSITTYTELPTMELRLAWNKMHDEWLHNYFHDCLAKDNLKMSCAHCSSIYLKVIFNIDSNGKAIDYTIVEEDMCGDNFTKSLETCFLKYFLTVTFPEGLRNMLFEITIGNGLKC